MDKKELLIEQVERLRKMRLPASWKVAKLDVVFERQGVHNEWASVIYDDMNKTFYVKTNKSIVYPSEKKATKEAIKIMERANTILHETSK